MLPSVSPLAEFVGHGGDEAFRGSRINDHGRISLLDLGGTFKILRVADEDVREDLSVLVRRLLHRAIDGTVPEGHDLIDLRMLRQGLNDLTLVLPLPAAEHGHDLVHLLGQHGQAARDGGGEHLRAHGPLADLRFRRLLLRVALPQVPLNGSHGVDVLLPVLGADHADVDDAVARVGVRGRVQRVHDGGAEVVLLGDLGPERDLESHVIFGGVVVRVDVALLHGEKERRRHLSARGTVGGDAGGEGVHPLLLQDGLELRFEAGHVSGHALDLDDEEDASGLGGFDGILLRRFPPVGLLPVVVGTLALLAGVIVGIILDQLVVIVLVIQGRVLEGGHAMPLHVAVVDLRMEEVDLVGSHGPVLIAQDGIIRHVDEDGVVEQSGHLAVVQFVLDEDAVGLHQQAQRAEDVEVVRHGDGHGRLGEVHHDEVEGAEPLAGEERQALGRVAEPPLDPRVLEVRLRVKVLQALADHLLIQLQPDHHLHVGVLQGLVQEHGIPPPDEHDALHLLQVRRGEVHVGLVIVRPVRMADLQDVVEAHAHVGLVGILAPRHLLVEGPGLVHGVLEAGELQVGFARGGGLLLAVLHFVRVGVAGPSGRSLLVVGGGRLGVVAAAGPLFGGDHHVGVGTHAVGSGFGTPGAFAGRGGEHDAVSGVSIERDGGGGRQQGRGGSQQR
mmetsp:Transcript_3483/g.8854  ORF Transcript_3483/g.8854 Transcript_3483/m.8854 type:complete len:671 (+) Transcript_3483:1166-3178(+)